MKLNDWIDREAKREAVRPGVVISRLAKSAKVSAPTMRAAYRGMSIGTVATAQKISEATGGAVKVKTLLGLE